ncbi:uncharacterized protein LOC115813779 [Chanos chanos]|uniref:Uncharacterized protein LOC115813779 n=1 Tax=Chanos chanos TaxID=29144 RepID=A0A6J2VJV6_CHACN|nr:uncharacterized protein LOC115813779 [Chanos chanos]
MYQVAQQQNLEHFDKLEEFVTQVTKVIPELLSARQRTTLILGLRAKMILEMCKGEIPIDLKTVKAHLSGIQSLNMSESSDSEVNALQTNLMKLVMSLLEDPLKKEHFYQEVFPVEYGLDFDKALQVLIGYLLSRLEQLLPVPNFKQAAYYLNAAPSECMQTDCQPELLLSLLKSNYCGNLDKNDLPSIVVDRIISSLSLPPVTEVVISSFGNTDEDLRSLLSSEGPAQVSSNLCQEEDPKCQKVEEVEFQNCFGEEDVDKFGQGVEKIRLATKETQSSACSSPEDDGEPTYEAVNDAATSPVATKITLPLDVHSCAVANKGNQKVNSQKMYSKTPIRQNVTASKPKPQMLLSESLQQRIISELTGSTSSPLVRLSKTVQTGSSIQVLPESATEVTRPISAHTQPPSCSAECISQSCLPISGDMQQWVHTNVPSVDCISKHLGMLLLTSADII